MTHNFQARICNQGPEFLPLNNMNVVGFLEILRRRQADLGTLGHSIGDSQQIKGSRCAYADQFCQKLPGRVDMFNNFRGYHAGRGFLGQR